MATAAMAMAEASRAAVEKKSQYATQSAGTLASDQSAADGDSRSRAGAGVYVVMLTGASQ